MDKKEYKFLKTARRLWKTKNKQLLKYTEKIEDFSFSEKSKKLIYLWRGKYFYSLGEYDKAKSEIKRVNKLWYNYFFPENEMLYEQGIYRFHFVRKYEVRRKYKFIREYLKNYDRVSKVIGPCSHKKKIDIYIYDDVKDLLGNSLCYADEYLQTINTNIDIKGAHELTHLLLGNFIENQEIEDFLNEGLATWLDMNNMSWFKFVHDKCGYYISEAKIEHSINSSERTREYYYIAGLTVGYLWRDSEKFFKLLKCGKTGELCKIVRSIYSDYIMQDIEKYYCEKGY